MLHVNQLIGFGSGSALGAVSYNYQTMVNSTADAITYTFSGTSIGTASQTPRYILVGTVGVQSSGLNRTISSVTVGGVTATQVAFNELDISFNDIKAFHLVQLDSGTTADIVVTWNDTVQRCRIYVWDVYSLENPAAAYDSDNSIVNPMAVTVDIALGGAAFAVAGVGGTARSFTWTNATEREDSTIEGTSSASAADYQATAAESRTITATPSGSATGYNMLVCTLR